MSNSLGVKKFRSLLFASSAEMALTVIALLSDSMIAGHSVGEAGLAAMSVIIPIMSVILFFGAMFSVGLAFFYDSALGALNTDRASGLFGMGLVLAGATSLAGILGLHMFFDTYLEFLELSPEVRRCVMEYYACYKFVLPIMPFTQLMSTMVYNDGDELISNFSNITNIFGNIVLSLIFVFVLKMGMYGIALGTLIKEILCLAVLCCHFLRKTNSLRAKAYFSFRDLLKFIKYGFIDSGMFLMTGLLMFVMNRFVTARFGDFYLPALSMVAGLLELSVIFDGVAQAMLPPASIYYHENNYPAVRKVMNSAVKVSLIEGIVFSTVLLAFARYIPAVFDIDEPELVSVCVSAVRIIAPSMAVSSLLYLFETYYMIRDENALAVISSFSRNLIAVLLISIPLGLVGGLKGVWTGFVLAQVFTFMVCMKLAKRSHGHEDFPMYLEDSPYIADFDLTLSPENIISTRDKISDFLSLNNVPSMIKANVMLIAEEIGMLIYEKNKGSTVQAEYTVIIDPDNSIKFIVMDNGIIFDITDEDARIDSFRSFVVSSIMAKNKDRKNLLTTSFNRNVLFVENKKL